MSLKLASCRIKINYEAIIFGKERLVTEGAACILPGFRELSVELRKSITPKLAKDSLGKVTHAVLRLAPAFSEHA